MRRANGRKTDTTLLHSPGIIIGGLPTVTGELPIAINTGLS